MIPVGGIWQRMVLQCVMPSRGFNYIAHGLVAAPRAVKLLLRGCEATGLLQGAGIGCRFSIEARGGGDQRHLGWHS